MMRRIVFMRPACFFLIIHIRGTFFLFISIGSIFEICLCLFRSSIREWISCNYSELSLWPIALHLIGRSGLLVYQLRNSFTLSSDTTFTYLRSFA